MHYKTVNSGGSFGLRRFGRRSASVTRPPHFGRDFLASLGVQQILSGFLLDHAYKIREDNAQPIAGAQAH